MDGREFDIFGMKEFCCLGGNDGEMNRGDRVRFDVIDFVMLGVDLG